jgi:hypothetical protein
VFTTVKLERKVGRQGFGWVGAVQRVRCCKVCKARVSILMVVFCHNPMYLLPHTPCSQGKQLGKFLAPIGLKLIMYIFKNYPARSEFS